MITPRKGKMAASDYIVIGAGSAGAVAAGRLSEDPPRIGTESDGVVDARLRVHGVADASVFPRIPHGNTHAPALMVGEKAAAATTGRLLAAFEARPRWSALPGIFASALRG